MALSVESITKRMYIISWKVLLVTLRAFGMMPVSMELFPDKIDIKRSRTWEVVSAAITGTLTVLFPIMLYITYYNFGDNFLRKIVKGSLVVKCLLLSAAAVTMNARRQRLVDIARQFLVYCSVHPLRTTAHLKLLLVSVMQLLFFSALCAISVSTYIKQTPSPFCSMGCLIRRMILDGMTSSIFSLTDSLFSNQVFLLRQFIFDLNVDLKEVASSLEPPTTHQRPPRSGNDQVGLPGRDGTSKQAKQTLIFVVPMSEQAPHLIPPKDMERHTPTETLQVDLSAAPPAGFPGPGTSGTSGTSVVACGTDIGRQPETWRRLRLRQAYLYSLFKALNREYTWPNLCSVLVAFMESTLGFYYYLAAKKDDPWVYPSCIWGLVQHLRWCAVALICQLTTDQVTAMSNLLNKVLSSHCLSEEVREEVRGFSLQNTVLDVRFRVGDFIALDFSMIVTITGAVSTYLVILLQQYPSEITTPRVYEEKL